MPVELRLPPDVHDLLRRHSPRQTREFVSLARFEKQRAAVLCSEPGDGRPRFANVDTVAFGRDDERADRRRDIHAVFIRPHWSQSELKDESIVEIHLARAGTDVAG